MNARTSLAGLLLVAAAVPAAAQEVGTYMPDLELVDFAQSGGKSLDDYLGRTLLLEFFAHW